MDDYYVEDGVHLTDLAYDTISAQIANIIN